MCALVTGVQTCALPIFAANWSTPLGLVFVDGGHALDVVLADFEAWSPHVAAGGVLVFHDVFEDPRAGGQAPFEVWKRAVASGLVISSAERRVGTEWVSPCRFRWPTVP